MYHESNLGVIGSPYADTLGYIPQAGDTRRKFAGNFRAAGYRTWTEFRQAAIAWTAATLAALEVWRRAGAGR